VFCRNPKSLFSIDRAKTLGSLEGQMANVWANEQFTRYRDAARDLRAAADAQADSSVAENLREIAERYETLAQSIAQFRD
jgi:hypothetical protein